MSDPDSTVAAPATTPKDVSLTRFCSIDAATWFKRAEVQFRLKNVHSDTRKADYVLAALPDDVFSLLAEWLDDLDDNPVQYPALKTRLLSEFVPSPEERAERLIHLTRQPLGDQRTSTAFREMKALIRLPPASNGTARKLDLLRILWLLRLPDNVRAGITNFNDVSETDLLNQSDALQSSTKAASRRPIFAATDHDAFKRSSRHHDRHPTSSTNVPDDAHSCRNADDPPPPDDEALAAATYQRPRQPHRSYPTYSRRQQGNRYNQPPRGNAPRKADNYNEYCYFHSKFGHAARNCKQPCSWPKKL